MLPQDNCIATYYILPISYDEGIAGEKGQLVKGNAEGALFYQGYTPLPSTTVSEENPSQAGLPFNAPVNKGTTQRYEKGTCVNCEALHYSRMIINEHIRLPNQEEDIDDLVEIIKKVTG